MNFAKRAFQFSCARVTSASDIMVLSVYSDEKKLDFLNRFEKKPITHPLTMRCFDCLHDVFEFTLRPQCRLLQAQFTPTSRPFQTARASALSLFFGLRAHFRLALHHQRIEATAIHAQYGELQTID